MPRSTKHIEIASIGLATSQGCVSDIVAGRPAKRATAAAGIDPSLSGHDRCRAIAVGALEDCFGGEEPRKHVPLLVASCNGGASGFTSESWRDAYDSCRWVEGTIWANDSLPVFSSSCSSGLHALYAAVRLLLTGYAPEIVVLGVDILSAANARNFEALRVLTSDPRPWQPVNTGFTLGEAGVALRLVMTEKEEGGPWLGDVVLASDLANHSGLAEALKGVNLDESEMVIGQGTGPFEVDGRELRDLASRLPAEVPLTTPLPFFGHSLGASSLLSVALAALAWRTHRVPDSLRMTQPLALDGRRLLDGSGARRKSLISCRALNGACAVTSVTSASLNASAVPARWQKTSETIPLMNRTLRQIDREALEHRPAVAPDLVVVKIDAPLAPDERAMIGGRLLPSSVLELTPGFISQLLARRWSYTGGAICLVGGTRTDGMTRGILRSCENSGLRLSQVWLRGDGDERSIEWEC